MASAAPSDAQFDETAPSPRSHGFDPPSVEQLAGLFPQLEILELVGRGGMGAVYKARQRGLNRIVAVKILPPEVGRDPAFTERFSREPRAMAQLSHPNIVTVFDFGQAGGLFYFVMEYVDGANLRQLMHAGTLAPKEALAIIPQICDALQYAHDEGVVHRDIKPENILIDKKGRVKVADFGLSKLLGGEAADVALTGTHQVMGTVRYMAPEQMQGTRHVDHRADIYSLGVVIYELLTGEVPMGRFEPPSHRVQLDVRLDEVVLRTLEREPERRYQKASEIKTDMESIQGITRDALIRAFGIDYKSKTTLFGLPLVHVAMGIDPRTGRKRIAKGVVAVGDVAVGVLAMGGVAAGGVTFGGVAVGVLSIGGLALGLLAAIGGVAVGGFAFGGLAAGAVALGGLAVGYYAFGGAAFGAHVISSTAKDPAALEFFGPWAGNWMRWLTILGIAVPVFGALLAGVIWLVLRAAGKPVLASPHDEQRSGESANAADRAALAADPQAMREARATVRGPAIGLIATGILNWVVLVVGAIVLAVLATADASFREQMEASFPETAIVALAGGMFLLAGFIMLAGFKMLNLQSRAICIVGSVLAMIVSPGNLAGLPVGLWALVTLNQPKVKAAFAHGTAPEWQRPDHGLPPDKSARR